MSAPHMVFTVPVAALEALPKEFHRTLLSAASMVVWSSVDPRDPSATFMALKTTPQAQEEEARRLVAAWLKEARS